MYIRLAYTHVIRFVIFVIFVRFIIDDVFEKSNERIFSFGNCKANEKKCLIFSRDRLREPLHVVEDQPQKLKFVVKILYDDPSFQAIFPFLLTMI